MTRRYAAEIRDVAPYFSDLTNHTIDEDQVALAQRLIESKSAPLNLSAFSDRYETALLDKIKAKIAGSASSSRRRQSPRVTDSPACC